jgi:hypothetical protein
MRFPALDVVGPVYRSLCGAISEFVDLALWPGRA